MTNENWFLTFFTRTNNQFSHEHCARPKKPPPLYCWLLALWSLWKWTVPRWIEPYFPILLISNLGEKTLDSLHIFCYLSNVTCPQFRSRMFCASQEGMTNCIPMPTRAENTLRWNLPKICSTKKNLLASMNYKTLSHFSKVRWSHYFNFSSDFQTNFLSWLHCALSNACHTPITIISRLSQR